MTYSVYQLLSSKILADPWVFSFFCSPHPIHGQILQDESKTFSPTPLLLGSSHIHFSPGLLTGPWVFILASSAHSPHSSQNDRFKTWFRSHYHSAQDSPHLSKLQSPCYNLHNFRQSCPCCFSDGKKNLVSISLLTPFFSYWPPCNSWSTQRVFLPFISSCLSGSS